ncbi:ectopic P granules protein 5 homolog isoform X2 [Teleopsis dalmanni]|uniref:ectopic P granules protein 5 homolog isoform X2 n=1 Tax=Teleopsis dalmanni TaxID=139649 RepID=UPI0018CCBA54|nr:ectopic P granules protein 5 homolog isoform X2 [Teleopsis dalmanni]
MATLTKPKKVSKKDKTRNKLESNEALPEESTNTEISVRVVDDDNEALVQSLQEKLHKLEIFETVATSSDAIVSHDCFISSDYKEPDYIKNSQKNAKTSQTISLQDELNQAAADEQELPTTSKALTNITSTALTDTFLQDNKNNINETTVEPSSSSTTATESIASEIEQDVTPTAPPSSIYSAAIFAPTPTIIQYPNLKPLQYDEQISKVVMKTHKTKAIDSCIINSNIKPFTIEELRQIYSCKELEIVKQFELEFLMNSLLESYDADPLYNALKEYYNLQSKLTMNLYDVNKFRTEADEARENIWIEVPITKTFSNLCADRVEVKESVTYNIAQVDGGKLETASAALTRLYELVCYTYTTNLIIAKITKVKIDRIITDILSIPDAAQLSQFGTVSLHKFLDAETLKCVSQLRRAISILFHFSRKISPNANFDADLKCWLRKLVSLQLLLATKEDHWFLLFNILRCPTGVGSWATAFLQVPCSTAAENVSNGTRPNELPLQLDSPEINHCIAVLQILLLPIKKRNDYLTAFTQEISDPVKEERWILIDSDGEDSHTSSGECIGLKESDLIALLNQIPFEKLFSSVLNVEKFLNDYIIEADLITTHQMLRTIVFFSTLIDIFGEGMITYNTERYKQLAKRLGRLVRHTIQYVIDYHELFMSNNLAKDSLTCERIGVELNVLLMKACGYIYRTRNLATWQYFSSLPFKALSADTIYQLFYYLSVGFPSKFELPTEVFLDLMNSPEFWTKFNVANSDSSAEDLYYLLQAFFEMANERDIVNDWELIKSICLHIFNIGYINESTREMCYKTSRDMLVNLTLAYEDLLSCLLIQLKIRFNDIENAHYLFKSLPLENWKPSLDSFEILSTWLLHFNYQSKENMLSRIIISHLNWGFDSDGRLYLPHNIHVRMACLITEALSKHAPEVVGTTGITESVRQVSSIIDFSQSTKDQFATWCWSVISVLRLHLMDQNAESVKRTLQNPIDPLMFVSDLERIDTIYQGVTEKRPLALYVAILVSLHGHSIPLICQKGFELMKLLVNDYRYPAVIRCLELIVPLFLETPDTLANCENFHAVLNSILNADKTYLKMAKDVLYPNSVGPVLELFDNMIHHQITSYTDYGLATPLNLINVWLNCFTSLPNWQNSSVVFLLDKILRVAYQFPDARVQAVEYFRNYYKECNEWKNTNKSALVSFFRSNQSRIPNLNPNYIWLALVLLEIEFTATDSHFWAELLRQLTVANDKISVETALKKTTAITKISTFPAQLLVIYKYANLMSLMDINHPLFPIVNQKFFELFLYRVPLHYDEHSFQHIYGVSDKFYEFNVPLMKKIKSNLKAAETFYNNEATAKADDDALSFYYRNCAKMMNTYSLWLEDTSINKLTSDQYNFPPQYNTEKLREIMNGNTSHWTEFLYLPNIRKEQKYFADLWARKNFRLKSTKHLRSPLQLKPKTTPIERIKKQLSSYDKRVKAPKFSNSIYNIGMQINVETFKELKKKLAITSSTATKFHMTSCELNSINRNYIDTIVELYHMVPYNEIKIKTCNSLLFNRKCTNPARITVTLEAIRKNEAIERKIENYCERQNNIINEISTINVDNFAQAIEEISSVTSILKTSTTMNSEPIRKTGINLFYEVVNNITDVTTKFSPTKEFYTQILSDLAIFIQSNQEQEGLYVLELSLKRSELLKELADVFMPGRTHPEYFIKMYKFLIDSHLKHCDTKTLFVLFSKFDIVTWLESFRPKLNDIYKLLQLVSNGLESWSQPDSVLLQDQFRRHLVHIFDYDFPQHYGEVLQLVLDRISDQKLMPIVILDLLNSLLQRFNCEAIKLDTTSEQIREISIDFARRQNLFNLKAATDTIMLFARHFQRERLHHGLHGLYPKHKNYCQPLSAWFSCFGHTLVVQAICTYQDLLADQISDILFGSLIDMYKPWLIVYTQETMQVATSNWIRQFIENGKVLYPWSDQHVETCKVIIDPFIRTLIFVLEYLPASHKILGHTLSWYVHHYGAQNLESHIYAPIHNGLAALQWELYKPQQNYIDLIYDSLQKLIPEAHAMLGHIFIRINWQSWFMDTLPTFPQQMQDTILSRLFAIFIKIAFEPNIHMHITTSKILEDAMQYPWHKVEYAELENLLKWFVNTVEPAIVLKIPGETNYVDRAVLDLLRLSCGMMPELPLEGSVGNAPAKRVLYTRVFVRLLYACAAKNQRLLATKDGNAAFKAAFLELLNNMDNVVLSITKTKTIEEQKREALTLISEILLPMQTQSEETTNVMVSVMVNWQAQYCTAGNLLMCNTLTAIGHMNAFIASTYTILESSIVHYFRTSDESKSWHTPSWLNLMHTLQMSLDKLQLMPIIRRPCLLTLHTYILYKLEKMESSGEQITFLQDLAQLIQNIKTSPDTEPHLAIVWGLIISRGCKLLAVTEVAKKPLQMLGSYLALLSSQAESWGEGLLNAIGLKKDIITNQRKVLTRCLACVIFSLFPTTSGPLYTPHQQYASTLNDLSMLLANKKYQNIKPSIVTAVNIIKDTKIPKTRDVPHLVCRLISLFYQDNFLTTIPEVWDFDFKWP